MSDFVNLSRREFLAAGAGGLALGILSPSFGPGEALAADQAARIAAMVKIAPDGWVTIVVANSEMGQGISTGGAMMVAEELGADFSRVRWEMAPNDAKNFGRPNDGPQLTGGSSSVRIMMPVYRKGGAAAREMLLQAAAKQWKADKALLKAEGGFVIHPDGRKLDFGKLAAQAAKETPPADPPLKARKEWTIIGTSPQRLDLAEKVNGSAVFGLDVKLPGLLVASVLRPPVFGAAAKSFDATAAKAVKGVKHVVEISSGIAVVALDYWSARKGRDRLKVEWQATPNDRVDTAQLSARLHEAASRPGAPAE
jgi:isoquinoline 1-oxidoreductase beta subunit